MMRFFGQRWVYNIGNNVMKVDNAYDQTGWGQERLIVNDETIQLSEGAERFEQKFKEPWLASVGETELCIHLRASFFTVHCFASIGDQKVEPDAYFQANWAGERYAWPDETEWSKELPQKLKNRISETMKKLVELKR